MALKQAEIQEAVKRQVFEQIQNLFAENGEQFADFSIAVPVEVENKEYWAKVTVVCGQIKDTKTSPAFDPFAVAEEWRLEQALKEKSKAEKERAKAEKIARSKSKRKAVNTAE